MKIKVFEAEFHVHSQVLKIYSHHFNAFIDHPSKAPRPDVPSGSFKYEWITVVDEEGKSWYSADASEFTDVSFAPQEPLIFVLRQGHFERFGRASDLQ